MTITRLNPPTMEEKLAQDFINCQISAPGNEGDFRFLPQHGARAEGGDGVAHFGRQDFPLVDFCPVVAQDGMSLMMEMSIMPAAEEGNENENEYEGAGNLDLDLDTDSPTFGGVIPCPHGQWGWARHAHVDVDTHGDGGYFSSQPESVECICGGGDVECACGGRFANTYMSPPEQLAVFGVHQNSPFVVNMLPTAAMEMELAGFGSLNGDNGLADEFSVLICSGFGDWIGKESTFLSTSFNDA